MDFEGFPALAAWSLFILWATGWAPWLARVLALPPWVLGLFLSLLAIVSLCPLVEIFPSIHLQLSYLLYGCLAATLWWQAPSWLLSGGILLLGCFPVVELLGLTLGRWSEPGWLPLLSIVTIVIGAWLIGSCLADRLCISIGAWLLWTLWRLCLVQMYAMPWVIGDTLFQVGALVTLLGCILPAAAYHWLRSLRSRGAGERKSMEWMG